MRHSLRLRDSVLRCVAGRQHAIVSDGSIHRMNRPLPAVRLPSSGRCTIGGMAAIDVARSQRRAPCLIARSDPPHRVRPLDAPESSLSPAATCRVPGRTQVRLRPCPVYIDAETGFTYLRARYYDPTTGQFISQDPLVALTRSAYGYVGGNPLNGIDPSGQNPMLIGALIGGGIDLGIQLFSSWAKGCGLTFSNVNWAHVGQAALVGAALGGLGAWIRTARAAGAAGEILQTPSVANGGLRNIVSSLYRGTTSATRVGSGTTADAVRSELATGLPTAGKWHLEKALTSTRALTRWLANNPNAAYHDRLVAQSLLDDLWGALTGL